MMKRLLFITALGLLVTACNGSVGTYSDGSSGASVGLAGDQGGLSPTGEIARNQLTRHDSGSGS